MAIMFRQQGVAISSAATVVTHSLSATVGSYDVIVTPVGLSASAPVTVLTHGVNTVTLASNGAGGNTVDIACLVWHSIQGGPNGG